MSEHANTIARRAEMVAAAIQLQEAASQLSRAERTGVGDANWLRSAFEARLQGLEDQIARYRTHRPRS